jgi:cytochrome c oxidase subunit 2
MAAPAAMGQTGERETTGHFTWWLPEDVSTHGHEIDTLFNVVLWLTSVTFVGVAAAMLIFLWRYRHKPGRRAKFIHGNNRLETVWTLIPTVIMALIAAFSQSVWVSAKYASAMPEGEDVVNIAIIGKQFKWYFQYPGADGVLGRRDPNLFNLNSSDPAEVIGLDRSDPACKDDIAVLGTLVVPVGRPVRAAISSVDVLHSFWLPNFRVKQDTVPGLVTEIWFEATKTSGQVIGRDPSNPLTIVDEDTYKRVEITDAKPFDIVCAELCGQGHYTMRGLMYVVTEAQYEQYINVAQNNRALALEYEEEEE